MRQVRTGICGTLARWLRNRFTHAGAREDLDKSIEISQMALSVTDHRNVNRSSILNNYALGLQNLFELCGGLGNLDKAIVVFEEAHPNRVYIFRNLGHCYYLRFEMVGTTKDLD